MKVVIDGNISSGKTSQLNLLKKSGFDIRQEPIENWPLEKYYNDPVGFGFVFQLIVLQSHSRIVDSPACIYERFPGSGLNVFWPLMHKSDIENKTMHRIYNKLKWDPDIYIFINKSPKLCYEHLLKRNQTGDNSVSLEYLEQIDEQYQKYFDTLECPKYKIDGNNSVEHIHCEILNLIKTLNRN